MDKRRYISKKKVYTRDHGHNHYNSDGRTASELIEHEVPDSFTFSIPGQSNITMGARSDYYNDIDTDVQWRKNIKFDNLPNRYVQIKLYAEPPDYSILNYIISPRDEHGQLSSASNSYEGEIPINGDTYLIQEAIDHCINDLMMESMSGQRDSYDDTAMVYNNKEGRYIDYNETHNETWCVRKSHSFTDMVNNIRKSRIAKDDGPINQNIQVGDIYYVVLRYDMTTPIFYEIVGRNGSTMISYRELEEDRTYSSPRYNQGEYTTVPIPGSYYGDTSRSKVEYNEWSNDYGFAVGYAGEHWAFKWNGQPLRGNNMD